MSLSEIAETLRETDPDRFGASLLAPQPARERLWTLYALNDDLARAPLQCNEPLIAEMRVQWWIDQLDGIGRGVAPRNEPLISLAESLGAQLSVQPWADPVVASDLLISTAAAGAVDDRAHEWVGVSAAIFDVVYDPWPTALAANSPA